METITLLISIAVVVVVVVTILHHHTSKRPAKNLPPSPPSLPIIGHLHLLRTPVYLSIRTLSELYGPVVALRLGFRNALIVSSPEAAEEALIKNDPIFANHPNIKAGEILGYNNAAMFFSPHSSHWTNIRRLMSLKFLSTGQLNLLASIRADGFLSLIRSMVKTSFSGEIELEPKLFEMTYHSVSKMVVGKSSSDHGDDSDVDVEVSNQSKDIVKEVMDLMFTFNPGDFFPALGWLDLLGVERRMHRLFPMLDGFLANIVEERRRKRTSDAANGGGEPPENNRALLDVMLSMQETDPKTYTDEFIKSMILAIMGGGVGTIALTIRLVMLLLLSHPETLNKTRDEIDKNVGHERIMDESDLPNLPSLVNVIKETLRLIVCVQGLPHRESSRDCIIQGYHVPKGTILLLNVWDIQQDPALRQDVMSFNPERFTVEKEEGAFKNLAFGVGRRKCPGEQLGMRMTSAGVGVLVQCFDWEPMSKGDVHTNAVLGLTTPKGRQMVAKYKVRDCMVDTLSKI